MQNTWINAGIYPVLERIGAFQNYFTTIAKYLAAICFFMALLMAIVKIFLGVADAREQIIKIGTTTCIYLILMYIYPIAMKALKPFAMNLGYGAVMNTQEYAVKTDSKLIKSKNSIGTKKLGQINMGQGTESDFYRWLSVESKGVFGETEVKDSTGQVVQKVINLNVVDAKTGNFDYNKIITFMIAFLRIGFNMMPKLGFLKITLMDLLYAIFFAIALLVVFVCYFVCIINYTMCLIDYYAMMGFGVLMIPLSLWDGTKSYTEKLYGAIGAIILKLMIISAFMYLSIMMVLDIFVEMYCNSIVMGSQVVVGNYGDGYGTDIPLISNFAGLLELSISMIVMGTMLCIITMNTEKIAGFLNGGSPSMSFGEAAVGMAQMAAISAGGKAAGKAAYNVTGNARSAIQSSITAGKVASTMGESGGKAFAQNMLNHTANGAKNIAGSLNANKGKIASSLKSMMNMNRALGSEGYTSDRGAGAVGSEGYTAPAGGEGQSGGSQTSVAAASTGGQGGSSTTGGSTDGATSGGSSSAGGSSSTGTGSAGGTSGSTAAGSQTSQGGSGGSSSVNPTSSSGNGTGSGGGNSERVMDGVYGHADGNYEKTSDKLTGTANAMAQSPDYLTRQMGGVVAMGARIAKTYEEHKEGNRYDNGYAKNIINQIGKGEKGFRASNNNANGGMTVNFSKERTDMQKNLQDLYGKKVDVTDKGNSATRTVISDDGKGGVQHGEDRYQFSEHKEKK